MPYGDLIAVRRVAEAVKAPGWQTRDADDAGKIYSPSLRICWEKTQPSALALNGTADIPGGYGWG
jgi:hypothetical protein